MYLTLYKKSTAQTDTIDYNTLMSSTPIPTTAYYKTTIKIDNPIPYEKLTDKQQARIKEIEKALHKALGWLIAFKDNHETQYREFQIPKRSGGLRTIDAPNEPFKRALSIVKDIFENEIKCLSHNAAYAYTKQRDVLQAITIHQNNESNWYLKIDLTNFFPNCSPELILTQLMKLYPFYYISAKAQEELKTIIKICCLRNGLPQGTPMSPLLTNLVMVPYDYEISMLCKRGTGEHYVYTRYADDILISSKSTFNWNELVQQLQKLLQPFQIKQEKTRYGSKAGSNWNLGLMLNKDNAITLGSEKKKLLNAMLNNFIKDMINHVRWPLEDIYTLQGQLSWLKHIEPGYYNYIVQKYEAKYDIRDYRELIKKALK